MELPYCRSVPARRSRTARWRDLPAAVVMLLPSLVVLSVFVLYPLGRAVWLGHMRCDSRGENCSSNGWDQYVDVVRSNEFRDAVVVTFKFALITVPIGLALGIALAAVADKYVRGIGVFRAIFSSTVATSVAVASLMWFFLLEPSVGVLSNVAWLQDLFPVIKSPGLLDDEGTALPAVAASSIWAGLGFTFVLVTAGLQGIPRDLHEAAALDGASGVRRFWSITIPLLGPTLLFVVIVLTTKAFQAYGEIDLLTEGGPRGSTTVLTYLTYGRQSLIRNDDGLKSATAVLLFLMLLVLSAVQLRGIGRRVHYG
jgi:sn-glycerol 3-phosphate transport system permease protein